MSRVLGKLSLKVQSQENSEWSIALIEDTVDASEIGQLEEFAAKESSPEPPAESSSMRQLAGALLKELDAS